jgi:hypothetical protein
LCSYIACTASNNLLKNVAKIHFKIIFYLDVCKHKNNRIMFIYLGKSNAECVSMANVHKLGIGKMRKFNLIFCNFKQLNFFTSKIQYYRLNLGRCWKIWTNNYKQGHMVTRTIGQFGQRMGHSK